MKIRTTLPFLLLAVFIVPAAASRVSAQTQTETAQPQAATEPVANEIAQLRKTLQTLNSRLQAITTGLLSPDSKQGDNEKLKQVASNLDLLSHTEERAEVLRKQLIELIEKETAYRTRLTQMDEDMRPENIERSMAGVGGTRTAEMRDTRRRSLDSERKGLETLLAITSQSRLRLEEDVRQADLLVAKFRQRLFPLIDKQLDKLNPYD